MTSPLNNDAFRRWFGNSKVVDARGEPLVVYHGTPKPPFDAFMAQLHGDDTSNQIPFGIHFAEDIEQAAVHGPRSDDPDIFERLQAAGNAATIRAAIRLGYKSPQELWRKAISSPKKHGANAAAVEAAGERAIAKLRTKLGDYRRIIPVYLSIQHPLDARVELKRGTPQLAMAKKMLGAKWDAFALRWARRQSWMRKRNKRWAGTVPLLQDAIDSAPSWSSLYGFSVRGVPLLQDAIDDAPARVSYPLILAAGYDGVLHMAHYPGGIDYKTWVAFDPRQIKHATENVGTYDPADPSMYKNPRRTSRRPVRRTSRGRETSRR